MSTHDQGVIELPTEATIPSYMDPVYRFKSGDGDLNLKSNGAAFNLWDALATLEDDAFPIVVSDKEISLQEALQRAARLLDEDPTRAADAGATEETIEKVKARVASAGLS